MTLDLFKNILRFIILVLAQVLIVKNIELGTFINPFVYVMFILVLPFDTPAWVMLLLGFVLGITIDMFYDTPGLHAAATVFMAFCRPGVLKYFSPRDGYESSITPTMQYMGAPWFISYTGILVLLHHLVLFYLEVFKFSEFFFTLSKVLLSSIASIILIIVSQYLLYREKK